jgi:peptide/nickel transport system substrate-binding protein
VLRFIPQADVTVLDPVWTSVYVTRNHAYLVFDTLYGQDSSFGIQPQMVEGHTVEQDGRLWRLRLRDGLLFHDNTQVLARDCVASIRRWARRDAFGQTLMLVTDELTAADDRTIQFRLKQPFPFLPEALGKIGINMLPIMPERLANTDAFQQVTEMVGSGPFRFLPHQRVVGARAVYERFAGYRPRESGTPDWTTGPKVVHFDQVHWTVIPDNATAAAAMQRGEADWWEQPIFDLLPIMRRTPGLNTTLVEVTGNIGLLRMNQLFPPFDNPAIRRALLLALNQSDFMAAVVGDTPDAARTGVGYFAPNTPMASDSGLEVLNGPRDKAAARQAIEQAGYKGETVVVMTPSDYQRIDALCNVAADLFKSCGLNVELQATDWGSVIQRRASKAPVDQGGWSVFITTFSGADMSSPAGNLALRGNGQNSWFGWPTAPELERLRNQWLATTDPAGQRQIAAAIQARAFIDVPFLPLGQFFQPTTQSRTLVDGLTGMSLFWNIRRG